MLRMWLYGNDNLHILSLNISYLGYNRSNISLYHKFSFSQCSLIIVALVLELCSVLHLWSFSPVLDWILGYLNVYNLIVKVSVHYYGRLAAKQGWRFDSTYDHKDENGEPIPFVFVIGSGKVSPRHVNMISLC